MELMAVIQGLEALTRPSEVELITDSTYVGQGLTQWLPRWKAQGWTRRTSSGRKPIKNEDLWRRLDQLLQIHRLHYTPVRGHSGHPENQRCDRLAVQAYQRYLERPRSSS